MVARGANHNTLNNNETQLHPLVRERSGLVHTCKLQLSQPRCPPRYPCCGAPFLLRGHREEHRGGESRVTGMQKVTGVIKVPVLSRPTGDPR